MVKKGTKAKKQSGKKGESEKVRGVNEGGKREKKISI